MDRIETNASEVQRPASLAMLALFYAGYVVTGGLGHGMAIIPGMSITFWPPAGIFLAMLLLARRGHWWRYVLVACVAELTCNAIWFGNGLGQALVYFSANAMEALAAAWMIRRVAPKFQFDSLREVAAFAVLGGCVAPVIGATIIAATDHVLGKSGFDEAWSLAWLGDGAGLMIMTPLAFTLVHGWMWREKVTRARAVEGFALGAVLIAVALASFGGLFSTMYATLPVMLLVGLRFKLRGAAAALALVMVMCAAFVMMRAGRFDVGESLLRERLVLAQAFLGISSLSALLVAVLAQQHQAALDTLRATNSELEARVAQRTTDLRESESRLRLFIENAPAAIAMLDRDMCYLGASRRWREDYRTASTLTGRSLYETCPEAAELWRTAQRRGLAGDSARSDGDRVGTGDGARWIRWEVTPWAGADGTVGGVLISTEDISEQRAAEDELRMHRERLEQMVEARTRELQDSVRRLSLSERLAAMGTLSAGLGHDMANILVPMRMSMASLEQSGLSAGQRDELDVLARSMDYLKALTAGLRLLSLDPDERSLADRTELVQWWQEARPICQTVLPRGVELFAKGFEGLPPAAVASHALTQVVFNLIQNAGDSMRERGRGSVWVRAAQVDAGLELRVRDDGPGMTPEVQERCLDPFFTTKTPGKGTGLGLAIVQRVVGFVGGTIEIDSAPERGTEFRIVLPRAKTSDAQGVNAIVKVSDPRTRAVARALLDGRGARVMDAAPAGGSAGIMLADGATDQAEVDAFLKGGRLRQVIRLGETRTHGGDPRVIHVAEAKFSHLRDAIARAMGDLGPNTLEGTSAQATDRA